MSHVHQILTPTVGRSAANNPWSQFSEIRNIHRSFSTTSAQPAKTRAKTSRIRTSEHVHQTLTEIVFCRYNAAAHS